MREMRLKCILTLFLFIGFSVFSNVQAQSAQAIADPIELCGAGTVNLHGFLSSVSVENPEPNSNLDQLKVIITFDETPESYQVSIAPLKYNKLFGMGMHLDDGGKDIYSHAYPFFHGGEVDGTIYPGLKYTDGCGNDHLFTGSAAVYAFDNQLIKDVHDPNDAAYAEINVTWTELIEMYNENWGIYNHGLSGSEDASEYIIQRAHSYMKRMIYEHSGKEILYDGKVFVNPGGKEAFTPFAVQNGYLVAYRLASNITGYPYYYSADGWPLDIGEVSRFVLTDEAFLPEVIADDLYQKGQAGNQAFASHFCHNILGKYGDPSFEEFMDHWQQVADEYGKDGLDVVWMTTEEEVINYLVVKDNLRITETLTGNTLELTFSGNFPEDLRFYATSLLIDSESSIQNIAVEGASRSSTNSDYQGKGLVNLDWDGKTFVPPFLLAAHWVAKTEESEDLNDALIAIDYISMLSDQQQINSFKQRLCNAISTGLPDGFCDDLGSQPTYNWSSDNGFSSNKASASEEIFESTTYTLEITQGADTYNDQVAVIVRQVPQLTVTEFAEQVCANQPIQLQAEVLYGDEVKWETSGTGDFDNSSNLNAMYSPSVEDMASGQVELTLTAFGASCTDNPTKELVIDFVPAPVITLEQNQEICEGENFTLNATVENADEILWTSSGDGVIQDATSETLIYTPGEEDLQEGTVEFSINAKTIDDCSYDISKAVLLTIKRKPIVDAGDDFLYCPGQDYAQVNGTLANSDSFLWKTTGDGTFVDNQMINAQYAPGSVDIASGGFKLVLEATSDNDCNFIIRDTVEVTTLGEVIVVAGEDQVVCHSDTVYLNGSSNQADSYHWAASGGLATGSFGAYNNKNTYFLINPSFEGNEIEIWLHGFVSGCNGYYETDTVIISVNQGNTLDLGEDLMVCEDVTSIQLNAASNYEGEFSWHTLGDGSFSDDLIHNPVYDLGDEDIANRTFKVYCKIPNNDICGGDVFDTLEIGFYPLPEINVFGDQILCSDQIIQVHVEGENYDSLYWYSNTDGFFNENNTDFVSYSPSDSELTSLEATLFVKAINSECDYEVGSERTVQLVQRASILFEKDTIEVCMDGAPVQISGVSISNESEISWLSNGYGEFELSNIQNPVFLPDYNVLENGYAQLTISVSGEEGCTDIVTKDLWIYFVNEPIVFAGEDKVYCIGENVSLSGSESFSEAIQWTTNAAGDFVDENDLNTQFIPEDNQSGEFMFVLQASSNSICDTTVTDTLYIMWNELPWIEIEEPEGMVHPGCSVTFTTEHNTDQTPVWNCIQIPGISNVQTDSLVVNLPDPYFQEILYVSVQISDPNGCVAFVDDEIIIPVLPRPEVEISVNSNLICSDEDSIFLYGEITQDNPFVWVHSGSGTLTDASSLNPIYLLSEQDKNLDYITFELRAEVCDENYESDSKNVFIKQALSIEQMENDTVCLGESVFIEPNVLSGNVQNAFWESSDGGSFTSPFQLNTVFFFNNEDYDGQDSVILTLSAIAEEPCDEILVEKIIYIHNPVQLELLSNDTVLCETDTYIDLQVVSEHYNQIVWISNGSGEFENNGSLSARYYFSEEDVQVGSVTISCSADGLFCEDDNQQDQITIDFQLEPELSLVESASMCPEIFELETLLESVQETNEILWSSSGDGVFSDPNQISSSYTPGTNDILSGEVMVSLTAMPIYPCGQNTTSSSIVHFEPKPTFQIIDFPEVVCEGEVIKVLIQTEYCESVIWSSSSDGTFISQNLDSCLYLPTEDDVVEGFVTIQMEFIPESDCFETLAENVTIEINPLPQEVSTPEGPQELCSGEEESVYSTSDSDWATSYLWEVVPTEAADYTSLTESNEIVLSWNPEFVGEYSIQVQALNDCGETEFSEELLGIINLNPEPHILVSPNDTVEMGDTIILDAFYSDFSEYLWFPSLETSEIIEVDSTGHQDWFKEVVVQVIDENNCVGYDTVNLYFDLNHNVDVLSYERLHVFPNPAKDDISLGGDFVSLVSKVEIYSSKGDVIHIEPNFDSVTDSIKAVNIRGLSDGVYFIRVFTKKGNYLLKFVKQ